MATRHCRLGALPVFARLPRTGQSSWARQRVIALPCQRGVRELPIDDLWRAGIEAVLQRLDRGAVLGTTPHILEHQTGHSARPNRVFSRRFGDAAWAVEERVAELGSAFAVGIAGSWTRPTKGPQRTATAGCRYCETIDRRSSRPPGLRVKRSLSSGAERCPRLKRHRRCHSRIHASRSRGPCHACDVARRWVPSVSSRARARLQLLHRPGRAPWPRPRRLARPSSAPGRRRHRVAADCFLVRRGGLLRAWSGLVPACQKAPLLAVHTTQNAYRIPQDAIRHERGRLADDPFSGVDDATGASALRVDLPLRSAARAVRRP
ncbi:zincin-like metallopeptidase domain-containing protein [Variovorax saccharolyticus]|uniref:zincin-like metallopeptidase domain-containing protein n=1 Tax=Variovorax saccharolyticus TaxID=3053516 RepID=UPI002576C4C3|nr:zincin-like metallopeptidase domain-containing protein [Variovorax sp. J31P216]MDM0030383.1 zincin-like metallopeptidase domain-containing protein [Variovorax sp. J31P216]